MLICGALMAGGCGSVAKQPDADTTQDPDAPPQGPDPDDGMTSGTRLKILWADFDGTRIPVGTHDAMRGEDCYTSRFADGNTYCVPPANDIQYKDAACSQAVGVVYSPATCPTAPPDYLIEYQATPCNYSPSQVYRRGPAVAGNSFYSLQSDGSCGGPYTDPSYHLYSLGAVVPTSELVKLTLTHDAGAGRYTGEYLTSTDGAKLLTGVFDTGLDTSCYFNRTTDSATTGKCFPRDGWYTSNFSDASCTQPKAGVPNGCPAPDYIYTARSGTCSEDYQVRWFQAGAASGGALYYSPDGISCSSTTADPSYTYYPSGAEVSLPPQPWSHDPIAGRQIVLSHYTEGDARFRDYEVYDTTHEARCYVMRTGDQARCVPLGASVQTGYYSDAGCTQAIDVIYQAIAPTTCDPYPIATVAYKYVPGCPSTYEVYEVGAQIAGSIYSGVPGSCFPDSGTDHRWYRVGARVPDAELGNATIAADP